MENENFLGVLLFSFGVGVIGFFCGYHSAKSDLLMEGYAKRMAEQGYLIAEKVIDEQNQSN